MDKLFPSDTICITKYFDAHQDWDVPIEGFFIIAARRVEIKSIAEFTPEEAADFMHILIKVRRAMKEVLGVDKVILFQNEASMHEFHIWLFPHLSWMSTFGTDLNNIRTIIDHAKNNFITPQHIGKVKDVATKVRNFLS